MISYSLIPSDPTRPDLYSRGFKIADTDDVERIARGVKSHVWSGIVWKDGYRHQDNFLYSDWCVLDFDEPDYTLAEACRAFCDVVHIIGTTKSHQKITPTKPFACDRFRVALKWERRITDLRVYRWNMQKMRDRYPIDKKALDGARYFFPCTEIIQTSADGELWDVDENLPDDFDIFDPEKYAARNSILRKKHDITQRFPRWIEDFLSEGKYLDDGRNYTCFRASISMLECGYSTEEIYGLINGAPFDRKDFSDKELRSTINSGLKRYLKDGGIYG